MLRLTSDGETPVRTRGARLNSVGLSDTESRRLDPKTGQFTFQTTPGGLQLSVGSTAAKATFTRTVIVGSSNTVSAVTPQPKGSKTCRFVSWSDGEARTHTIIAPTAATTYTARFR